MIRWLPAVMVFMAAVMAVSCSRDVEAPGGSGLIEATEITVSAETSGRVEEMYFKEGDKIRKGDIITLIDTTTVALKLDQARAAYRAMQAQRKNAMIRIEQAAVEDSLAQKEYMRMVRLLESGSANQQQYDRVETAARQTQLVRKAAAVSVESAEAELARIQAEINLLKKQLSDCRPVSPAAGTVVTTYVEEGELISVGRPIFKIARLDTVWVKVYLPPADLTGIKLGDPAEVDPEDGKNQPLPGTISWISSEAEFTPKNIQTRQARADLVYAVKIMVPNRDEILKIGMPVAVAIP